MCHRLSLLGVMRKEDGGGSIDWLAKCGLCWFFGFCFVFIAVVFVCLFLTRVQGLRRAVNWMVLGLRV